MGCFSVNCGITNHAIYNDRVVVFKLKQNQYRDKDGLTCYADSEWLLDYFPFRGVCDTYGGVVIDSNCFNYQQYLTDYNPNSDSPKDVWMFVSEDVYEFVLKQCSSDVRRDLKNELRLEFPTINRGRSIDYFDEAESIKKTAMYGEVNNYRLHSMIDDTCWESKSLRLRVAGNQELERWWVTEALRLVYFKLFMEECRLVIRPSNMVGHQHDDYKATYKLNNFMVKRAKKLANGR